MNWPWEVQGALVFTDTSGISHQDQSRVKTLLHKKHNSYNEQNQPEFKWQMQRE